MSLGKLYYVRCNGCYETSTELSTAKEARKYAVKTEHWKRVKNPMTYQQWCVSLLQRPYRYWFDLCPKCAKEKEEAKT